MKSKLVYTLLFFCYSATGQPILENKCTLPEAGSKAITRVHNLLASSQKFAYHFINADSAMAYATQANKEARAIHYNCGEIMSLLLMADVKGRLLSNAEEMEMHTVKALKRIDKADVTNTAAAYRMLFLSLTLQGRFHGSEKILDTALAISERQQDMQAIGWTHQLKGFAHAKKGQLTKAFEELIESHRIGNELGDSAMMANSLVYIARIFNYAGEHRKAIQYYQEGLGYVNNTILLLWPHLEDLGYAYLQTKQYDSAIYWQKKHWYNLDSILRKQPHLLQHFVSYNRPDFTPIVNIARENYNEVLRRLLPQLQEQRRRKNYLQLMYSLLAICNAYLGKGEYTKAIDYGRELKKHADQTHNDYFSSEASQVLALLFHKVKQNDSAYLYLKNHTAIKDTMATKQFLLQASLYELAAATDSRIQILLKDKAIQQQNILAKENELQKKQLLQKMLLAAFIVLGFLTVILLRNVFLRRKNERLESQRQQVLLQKKAVELEMQALRAQMNPHFIFNCLSAIDSLVQTNQTDKATAYLARFAKLIRVVLESSKINIVPFQYDYETMQLYLEMEQFRCNYKFNYKFCVEPDLMLGDYKVPSLIIQPFIENAIHHGLLNKPGSNRQLTISASIENEYIIYNIIDNGIGQQESSILRKRNRPDHQSYGVAITKERINLYNNNCKSEDVQIVDMEKNGMITGTKAVVRIIADT